MFVVTTWIRVLFSVGILLLVRNNNHNNHVADGLVTGSRGGRQPGQQQKQQSRIVSNNPYNDDGNTGKVTTGRPIKLQDQDLFFSTAETKDRRRFLAMNVVGGASLLLAPPNHAARAATDVVNNIPTDEITVTISKKDWIENKGGLGIEIGEVEFKTNLRVYIKSVRPESLASKLGIKENWILVDINGESTERTNAEGVAIMVSKATAISKIGGNEEEPLVILGFRDPVVFRKQLNSLDPNKRVTTQIAPAGDTTQRNPDGTVKPGRTVTEQSDQRFTVEQLVPPKLCGRPADTDDLLEISYLGTVAETGMVFDGSAIKINGQAIPGRGGDVSLFFVLGKQPFGQFPPGWDVGLVGMCVGERRRLLIPPALAYGSKGLPRRNIPPDATLQYDITLVSINGLATPQ